MCGPSCNILVYTTTKKSLTNDTYLSGILLSINSSEVMLLLKRERSKRKPAINKTLPGRENTKSETYQVREHTVHLTSRLTTLLMPTVASVQAPLSIFGHGRSSSM